MLSRLLRHNYLLCLFWQGLNLLRSVVLGLLRNNVMGNFRVRCVFKSNQVELLSASFGHSPGFLALFRVWLYVLVFYAPETARLDFVTGEKLVLIFLPRSVFTIEQVVIGIALREGILNLGGENRNEVLVNLVLADAPRFRNPSPVLVE